MNPPLDANRLATRRLPEGGACDSLALPLKHSYIEARPAWGNHDRVPPCQIAQAKNRSAPATLMNSLPPSCVPRPRGRHGLTSLRERTLLLFCSEGQAARRVARLEQQNCRPNVGLKLRVRPQRRDGRKMTAEIAIINRTAVTLAADSAIALDVEGTSKVYNTADKLFELTTAYPVGVMVYNNMNYLEIPLEVVIKSYRNSKR